MLEFLSEWSKCKARLNAIEDAISLIEVRLQKDNDALLLRILALENSLKTLPSQDTTLKSRLEDLELWRAKMHTLLISTTPATKKEKLNSIALSKLGGGKF